MMYVLILSIIILRDFTALYLCMHVLHIAIFVHGRRNRGAQGARAPPIILPSEIFLTQYALLSRKLAHKMFIFNKIFRLASLANEDSSN